MIAGGISMIAGGIDLEHLEVTRLFLFGDVKFIDLLVLLMAVDIVTGFAKAWKNENLWSRKSLFGFARKMLVFAVIIMANVADQVLGLNGIVAGGAVLFYIGNEGLSITENLSQMNVPIPQFIKEKFHLIEKESFKDEVSIELVGSKVEEQLEETRKVSEEGSDPRGSSD